MRVGELTSLRLRDINLNSDLSHVTVDGKTGMRRIPIMFSVPYITRYLDTIRDAKPDDQVWKPAGTWSNRELVLDTDVIRKIVQRTGKLAGIQKRIYPHLFRHSRASYYANRLTEQQLKVFFGWTGSSTMAATYVHLSGRDIDNAILQANGVKPIDSPTESKLKVRICPKCRYENAVSALHCTRCGSALDIATAMKEEELEKKAEELAARSYDKKKEREDVVRKAKEKRSK